MALPTFVIHNGSDSVLYQASVPKEGVHFLVLVARGPNRTLAQWYAPDGTRTSFGGKGKFALYQQTLDQQYRSLAAGDPEGERPDSPKTTFTYLDDQSGLLKSVRDEQGRTTTYTWDAPTRRLQSVVESGPGGQGVVKRTDIQYTHLWKYWYVSEIAERAPDGLGGESVRRMRYSYSEYSKPSYLDYDVRLTGEHREVTGTNGDVNAAQWLSTFYTKDKDGRVTGIRHVAGLSPEGPRSEPDTTVTYARSKEYGGELKTTVQGEGNTRHERAQHFDPTGKLRREDVWSFNPTATGEASKGQFLTRTYAYDAAGNQTSQTEPSGKRVQDTYDDLGRRIRRDVFVGDTKVRSTLYEYDAFNHQSAEVTPEASGQGYKYPELRHARTVTKRHTVEKDGVKAELPATIEETTSVGGTVLQRTVETYDTQGRLLSTDRTADGHTKSSRYTYGDGQAASFALVLANGQVDETRVRTALQPTDRVASQTIAGVTTEFTYDVGGNAAVETVKNGLVTGHDKGQAITRDRRLLRGFDGWGNKTSESAFTGAADKPKIESVTVWKHYGTGELRDSWEGTPDNVTAYAYGTAGHTGRLVRVTQGVGLDAERSAARTIRTGTEYNFDAFGRSSGTVSVTGQKTALGYDTLDRVVHEERPDGVTVDTSFDPSGTPSSVTQTDSSGQVTSVRDVDALGRITREQIKAGRQQYEIARSFDPYDRVLKARDSRLDMNRPGDDQATYFVYDARGLLVKQLGAAMNTNGAYYDDRRPYTESSFDGLGRKTEQRVLLAGVLSPSQLTPDPASNLLGLQAAVTTYTYDDDDHLIGQTDPAGFTTTRSYDGVGNVASETRQVTQAGSGVAASSATSLFGHDGAGRRVETTNALGERTLTAFNTLGLPIAETDALGNTRKLMTYTADGLLTGVAQPQPGVLKAQAVEGLQGGSLPTAFVWTTTYQYGTGQRTPTERCDAHLGQGADAKAACTTTQYDAAGRPTRITLPDGSSEQREYNARGQLLRQTTPDGRRSTFSYDALGQLSGQVTAPNDADRAAGLTDGWQVQYQRDGLGRVTAQTVNGVRTTQVYNSLGLLVAQSRPATDGARDVPQELRAYRLDGQLTAQTTFGYAGALRGPNARSAIDGQLRPDVSAGALTVFDRNARGDLTKTSVFASGRPDALMTANYQVNGLGLTTRRDFTGDASLYRAPVGDGAAYSTVYQYDAAGRLTAQWDEADGQRANVQNVQYSPAGQITSLTHDLRVLGGGQILAASEGTTTARYDARGELIETRVQSAGADQTTSYAYHAGGQLARASVQGGGSVTLDQYDQLGRLVSATVSAGSRTGALPASATLATTYGKDGGVTRQVLGADGGCLYQRTDASGLGGLLYASQEWTASCGGTPGSQTSLSYGANAQPVGQRTVLTAPKGVTTTNLTRRFDALLNVVSGEQTVTTSGDGTAPRSSQWTGSFTPDGRLQTLSVQAGASSAQTSYALDALGRKVGLTDAASALNGWRQYYDADGRVGLLEGPLDARGTRGQVAYRYDLNGDAALSSEAAVAAGRVTARAYDVQGLPGQPQLMSLRAGTTTRTRDVTYSLLEGALGERWETLAPLGTGGTLSSLAAPGPLTSAQFGLSPTAVRPPEADGGSPLTPLSVIADTRNLAGGLQSLQAAPTSLPSQLFGLKPGEVTAGAASAQPQVGQSGGTVETPSSGGGASGSGLLASDAAAPTASLLDELHRLQREQRGALDDGGR